MLGFKDITRSGKVSHEPQIAAYLDHDLTARPKHY